jgi:hypothetical protein
MSEQLSKLEALRLARLALGGTDSEAIAAYIDANLGITIKPAMVAVVFASLREREKLEQNRRKARVELERLRTEQVEAEKTGKTKRTRQGTEGSYLA